MILNYFSAKGLKSGFYIDVGAGHPFRSSNTASLYHSGWSGITIDPFPGSANKFRKYRPRDTAVEAAVSAVTGKTTLYYHEHRPLLSTVSEEIAKSKTARFSIRESPSTIEVQTLPLRAILDKYLPGEQSIDFLDLDTEGSELDILESNNWDQYRPGLILIETERDGRVDVDARISNFLNNRGYQLIAFNGVNAFYENQDAKDTQA